MTAARIARGATARELIVKFDGAYHGHSDLFLVQAGSGLATASLPASGGVPPTATQTTISLPYNDLTALKDCFAAHGSDIAGVIVEPVAANMGVVAPQPGFLEQLRAETTAHGALLIFDEVITGFRLAPGGAAGLFGVSPDLVCLGKILGGGMPIGGVGGRREVMDVLAPSGAVYQAGTLAGNPISTAAGVATLSRLKSNQPYDYIRQYADDLSGQLAELFSSHDVPVEVNRVESLFTIFFSATPVVDFESAKRSDMETYARLFHLTLNRGVFIPPSGFEAWFVSVAHSGEHLNQTLGAVREFLKTR